MKCKALAKIGTTISNKSGRTRLIIKKNSPELLLAGGIIGFVGTVILASKATLTAQDILKNHEERLNDIKDAIEVAETEPEKYEYDDDLKGRDKLIAYSKTAGELVKAYAPAALIGGASLACIFMSHSTMKKRYLGAVAAYNTISGLFTTYRNRVIEEQGAIMDRHYLYGTEIAEVTKEIVDENGKKKKVTEKVEVVDPKKLQSDLSIMFDESNPNWDINHDFNMAFLKAQESYANNILHARGHIFLNEIYDMLGYPQTQAGAIVGWVDGSDEGDSYIDFGLCNVSDKNVEDFREGKSNVVLLDFNYDGIIWDKI